MISYALSESLLIYNFLLESDKIVKLVLLALYSYLSICGNFLRFVRSSLDAFSEFTCTVGETLIGTSTLVPVKREPALTCIYSTPQSL